MKQKVKEELKQEFVQKLMGNFLLTENICCVKTRLI